MLQHLLDLIAADGEVTARRLLGLRGAVSMQDCAIVHADTVGVEAVDSDGARVFVPWATISCIEIELL